MDFLCSNLVKTIFTYWIGTVFNLILQLAIFFMSAFIQIPYESAHLVRLVLVHPFAIHKNSKFHT